MDDVALAADDPLPVDGSDLLRSAAIGLIAGLAAAYAMDRFQAAITALSSSQKAAEPATDKAADRITKALTGRKLSASARPWGGHVVHYTLGAGLGAVYGAVAERRRGITIGYGAVFGIGVAAVLDDAAVPAVGLGDPPWKTSVATHVYALMSHVVFGTVTELTRARLDVALRRKVVG